VFQSEIHTANLFGFDEETVWPLICPAEPLMNFIDGIVGELLYPRDSGRNAAEQKGTFTITDINIYYDLSHSIPSIFLRIRKNRGGHHVLVEQR
jgi:hypothetical protein